MRPRTITRIKRTVLAAAGAVLLGTGVGWLAAPTAHADPLPPNCLVQSWGFLGSQQRAFCDTPVRRDGSWDRHRVIAVPEHYVPLSCYTSYGRYSASTNCSGGYIYPFTVLDDEVYPVTTDTVLPDEPGHLGSPPPV